MTVLRRIWKAARLEYHWAGLLSPFEDVSDYYPKPINKKRRSFRFGVFLNIKKFMDPFYHPIVDFYLLTGAIASEVAGLKKEHIDAGYIHFQESHTDYHDDDESGELKEDSRNRKMPITKNIAKCLEVLLQRSEIEYVFVMKDGTRYNHTKFRENIWNPAVKKAKVSYVPNEARHSFVAWCHIAGIDTIRIVSLAGHADKDMVDRRYGFYVQGLENDRAQIIEFFGEDFVKSTEIIEQPLKATRRKKIAQYRKERDDRI